jgi:hypothetical protein
MAAAHAVLDLAGALRGKLAESGSERLLTDIELPLVGVLAEMEQVGIAIDDRLFQELEKGFSTEAAKEVDAARAEAGVETLNLGSPKQLQEVLFENLGMPKTKKIKTGYTTDADSLAWLQAQTQHRGRGPVQVGLGGHPHPHHLQPDDRRHRPAVLGGPEPAEHPDPHPGRPADPQGLHRRSRL